MRRKALVTAIFTALMFRVGKAAPAYRSLTITPDGIAGFVEYPYYGYKAG